MERIQETKSLAYKDFEIPSSVVQKTICTRTGLLATGSCPSLTEYFAKDNAPTQSCSGHYVAPEPSNDDPSVEDPDNPNNSANGDDPSGTNGDNSGTVPTPSEPDVQPAP